MPVRLCRILPILILLASPQAFAEWAAYTSDNFTVYSDTREDDAVEMLENFEMFRHAVLTILNLPDEPESERLLIVIFDRGRDFNRIRSSSNTAGFFYHSVFGPRMMVGPSGKTRDTQITLFHEYVHYLMNRHASVNFPRWYFEGFATLLSTAEIAESEIIIGKAPPNYSAYLRLGFADSIHGLIDIENDGFTYLMAWLLTHYLVLDPENAMARRESTLDYLRRFDAGEDPLEAFTDSFGISPEEMQRELVAYSGRPALPAIFLPRVPYRGELSRRVMTEAEALYRLGDIAVERDAFEAAHDYFDRFEESAPGAPFRANVKSRRAIVYIHEERIDEGDALIDELLAADVGDDDVLADIAHYAYDRFVHERDDPDAAAVHLARSIDHGVRAVEADPGDTEALYYLGLAYEADGDLQLAVDTMIRSYDINPSVRRLNMNLVRMLIKGNQPEVASHLVSRLYSASHSADARAMLLDLQQRIETGDIDLTELGDL